MKSRITKFAAAVIIIAVGVTFTLIGNGPAMAHVSWDQVAQNLQKIKTLKYRRLIIIDEIDGRTRKINYTLYISAEFGSRQEDYRNNKLSRVTYVPARGNETVRVFPDRKQYEIVTGAEVVRERPMWQADLSLMVARLMETDHVEIGSKTIDGIKAEGIKFTGLTNVTKEFWVDPQTNMPVLLYSERDFSDGRHMKEVFDQFEWTELTAEDFKPNIPADYKPTARFEGAPGTEESAILGLKGFTELTGGIYPSSLLLVPARSEAWDALNVKIWAGGVKREATQQEDQQFSGHNSICKFYADLSRGDYDVAYYGKTVIVGDAEQVLLRWRLEDGQYRVIFGDLHTETVSAKRLAELEGKYLTLELPLDWPPERHVNMKLVRIPAGEFLMGSPSGESGREGNEGPQHQVKLTKAFYMGMTEVTQLQYLTIMGANPSWFWGKNNPVEVVSWNEAQSFCAKVSSLTGRTVRLPTEAEWEYACRAGTTTRYSFGDSESSLGEYAWYDGNSGGGTHPVAIKSPNPWGLYDMHGNVFEWCSDWYGANSYPSTAVTDPQGPVSGSHRVLRGGSWARYPRNCRSAYHNWNTPDFRYDQIGFRVVLELDR